MIQQELVGSAIALLSAVLWGFAPIFYKKGEMWESVWEGSGVRAFLSLGVLLSLALCLEPVQFVSASPVELAIIGLATISGPILGDTAYLISVKKLGASLSTAISYSYPIFTSLLSFLFIGEILSLVNYIGIASTVMGLILVSRPTGEAGEKDRSGIVAALVASILWSSSAVIFSVALREHDFISVSTWKMIFFFLVMFPPAVKGLFRIQAKSLLYLNLGGLAGLGVGGLFYLWGVSLAGVSRATTLSALSPLMTTIAARELLKERVGVPRAVGIGLISLGIALVSLP